MRAHSHSEHRLDCRISCNAEQTPSYSSPFNSLGSPDLCAYKNPGRRLNLDGNQSNGDFH